MSTAVCPNCQGPKQADHYICPVCFASGVRRSSPHFGDGPPMRGISDLVAVALVALDLDTVRRSTVRALLPAQGVQRETGESTKMPIRDYMRFALRRFERRQWIRRDGAFVHVLSRSGLRAWVSQGVDISGDRAATMLAVQEAVRQINADLDSGALVSGWDAATRRRHAEVRRQELIALQRLMQATPGGTARPGVRIVPRGRAL